MRSKLRSRRFLKSPRSTLAIFFLIITTLACARDVGSGVNVTMVPGGAASSASPSADRLTVTPRPTRIVLGTPTPDPTHPPSRTNDPNAYVVKQGDTLGSVAKRFGVTIADIKKINNLTSDDLFVGQRLKLPVSTLPTSPSYKLIPDSEFVYGPTTADFNLKETVEKFNGYLQRYIETDRDGVTRNGMQIVQLTAERFSVNPRLLLALIEHQSGWLANRSPSQNTLIYPLGYPQPGFEGLTRQLYWAADQLSIGYYAWRENRIGAIEFPNGSSWSISPGLNAGTVAVQYFFARRYSGNDWLKQVTQGGFDLTYASLFGNPFERGYDPLLPLDLTQPALRLPMEKNSEWYFTGGPHGAWGTGSSWAALDFGPPIEGCVASEAWVVAAANGIIVRAGEGAVIQDLDGDGFEQTGWNLFYMHLATKDRIGVGERVKVGDRLGHPSCEGGFSNGSHLHFARKYNGEWIAADGVAPFNLSGWIVDSPGKEYDGWLRKGEKSLEACDCKGANQVPIDQ